MGTKHVFCFTALLIIILASSALAGWTVTYLNPAGYDQSRVFGISGGIPVGTTLVGGQRHASVWNSGTAASWKDLNPSGSNYSEALCIAGVRAYGYMGDPATHLPHAARWNMAGSYVDLHPPGGWGSTIYGAAGTQQVGSVGVSMQDHASRWTGTAATWADLHPSGFLSSRALATSGDQQVGWAAYAGYPPDFHAGLWNGTSSSWVDLNPSELTNSMAYGVSGGQQVGYTSRSSPSIIHASLWSGTAASYVDLNPSGYNYSKAFAVSGGKQVGHAGSRAGIWSGTAASWVNLHGLLNASHLYSAATCIEVVGSEIWIGGMATNSSFVDIEGIPGQAVMWHYTPDAVPEPGSVLVLGSGLLGLAGVLRRRR